MSFATDIEKFGQKVDARLKAVVTEGGREVHRSVVEGSELTGAPGQPVLTGELRKSFKAARISDLEWQVTTQSPYARKIEENTPGMTLHSATGGHHSIALTAAAWPRIVEAVVAKVAPK